MLLKGNCLDLLKTLPDNSVDSVVTDPPYELAFMGKGWDASGIAYNTELWGEVLRVLKPGGHLLAFGGTRTYHRLAVAIEDAGFEIRDSVHWSYGSGFPKSLDISKAIDKGTGENRNRQLRFTEWMRSTGITPKKINEVTGTEMGHHYTTHPTQPAIATADLFDLLRPHLPEVPEEIERLVAERTGIEWTAYKNREVVGTETRYNEPSGIVNVGQGERTLIERNITAPSTPEAQQWAGWGTALKPSHEPIVVARKPLDGTVAGNTLKWGVGGLNIDGTRVGQPDGFGGGAKASSGFVTGYEADGFVASTQGRWPANTILTHSPDCEQVGTAEDTMQAGERTANFGTQETQSGGNGSGNWGSKSVTVPVWSCVEGCPVRELDGQSGVSKSTGGSGAKSGQLGYHGGGNGNTGTSAGGFGDSGGASRFFTQTTYTEADWPVFLYYAKASKRERNAGLKLCRCDKLTSWVKEVQQAVPPAGTELSAQKATDGSGTPDSDGSAWNTTSSGNSTTAPSPTGAKSTTSITTNSTTESKTSNSLIPSPTSASTQGANSETEFGGSPAESAGSSNLLEPTTGISAKKAGPSTGDADPATSSELSATSNAGGLTCPNCGGIKGGHPTVKPVELMRHLIRLVTPPGGTVLDPFLGSGTTAVAAILERANWIGCEMTEDYWPIIEGRTKWAQEQVEGRLL